MDRQTRAFEQLAAALTPQPNNRRGGAPAQHQPSLESRLNSFSRLRPSTFSESDDPLVADDWLRDIERKLDLIRCTDEEKVDFAAHQLEGSASAWWDAYVYARKEPTPITWDEFCEEFREHHIPEAAMDRKAEEFRTLKLGHMTVAEYTHRFTQLSRYAPDEVATEKKKMYHYRKGLHTGMQPHLAGHRARTLREMIDCAMDLEDSLKKVEAARETKRKALALGGGRSGGPQRPRFTGGFQQRFGQGSSSSQAPRPQFQGNKTTRHAGNECRFHTPCI